MINGDFANKVGTYSLAVNCNYHKIPFYVAAPYTAGGVSCGFGLTQAVMTLRGMMALVWTCIPLLPVSP
jgi:hypothetical protein